MSIKEEIDDIKEDALREVGNIASGNAASSLSIMLDEAIDIGIPVVKILDYSDVVENLGGEENILTCVMLSLQGDLTGMIMFLIEPDFVNKILMHFTGTPFNKNEEINEMNQSAIQEIGNIMVSSYVNAMAEFTGLKIGLSTPSVSVDMVGAILSVPTIYYANISDKMVFIEDRFITAKQATSRIIMIPDTDSLTRLVESLGLGF